MEIIDRFKSRLDKTIKYRFLTWDNKMIEACAVFFKGKEAPINICVSTQLGCECNCSFCVTGWKRFIRDLTSEEIIEQVALITKDLQMSEKDEFEITYMGTGEPLKNIEVVLASAFYFIKIYKNLFRLNISTILPELSLTITELQCTEIKIHFQYSLHFIDDISRWRYFRKKLVPIHEALGFFDEVADLYKEPYCVNYILFQGINDDRESARRLVSLLEGHSAYLKVSQYSPIDISDLRPSQNYVSFVEEIDKTNIKWKSFSSQGIDIHAACGHLLSDIEF